MQRATGGARSPGRLPARPSNPAPSPPHHHGVSASNDHCVAWRAAQRGSQRRHEGGGQPPRALRRRQDLRPRGGGPRRQVTVACSQSPPGGGGPCRRTVQTDGQAIRNMPCNALPRLRPCHPQHAQQRPAPLGPKHLWSSVDVCPPPRRPAPPPTPASPTLGSTSTPMPLARCRLYTRTNSLAAWLLALAWAAWTCGHGGAGRDARSARANAVQNLCG